MHQGRVGGKVRMCLALGLLFSPLEAVPSLVETFRSQLFHTQSKRLMEPMLFVLIITMGYTAVVLKDPFK